MLYIKTYLDRSEIHGIGLFAGQEVIAGMLVWELNHAVDLAYTLEEWDSLRAGVTAYCFSNLRQLSYKEEGRIYICLDNAQFMNHSDESCNVGHYGASRNKMFALKDISRGEEILCNYLLYSEPDDYHFNKIINKHKGSPAELLLSCPERSNKNLQAPEQVQFEPEKLK